MAVLAEIQHPGVVRYIAHGRTAHGVAFLAMEWLEGQPGFATSTMMREAKELAWTR
jgi:hypothetical protein